MTEHMNELGIWSQTIQRKPTMTILEQMDALEQAKAARIKELIEERRVLEESTVARVNSIKTELKALGWFAPRKKVAK